MENQVKNLSRRVSDQIAALRSSLELIELSIGEILFHSGSCQVLSQSPVGFELLVEIQSARTTEEYFLGWGPNGMVPRQGGAARPWDRFSFACLLQVSQELRTLEPGQEVEHKKYTREGMRKRVLGERMEKANQAKYRIQWASNLYGDHILMNEKGTRYRVFLRDFEQETGYSDSMDARLNKLGTTKHIMFAFRKLKEDRVLFDTLDKTFPFIEIYCDPLNDYRITWYYPHRMLVEEQLLISRYFGKGHHIEDGEVRHFLGFIEKAADYPLIRIRPEVREKVEAAFEEEMLDNLGTQYQPDFSPIRTTLLPYQQEGIVFSLFRKTALIADEMGLGKSVQAIGTAVLKKQLFGFSRTLVICPASLKERWKNEIGSFSSETVCIPEGSAEEREALYQNWNTYFVVVSYETLLRDLQALNRASFDFLILDEAQRIKNYETQTAHAVSRLKPKHALVLTGTPIENRLIDLYSLVNAIAPGFFGPLWEFSYQHCLFDPSDPDRINGYYDLQKLKSKLDRILIRRNKKMVADQLPKVTQIDVPVGLSPRQKQLHGAMADALAVLLRKKFPTPYDRNRIRVLMTQMRMVCDSTSLVEDDSHESPKLLELRHILLDKLDLVHSARKVVIFSEWLKVHKMIGQLLRESRIGFAELNGSIPVKNRGELLEKFTSNPHCKVLLSTEAAGLGLNLQVADTLINFELPWNPAKKDQRIGRIDRPGQGHSKLTIFNLISRDSIEENISRGMLARQDLASGILGDETEEAAVDLSGRSRGRLLRQVETFAAPKGGTGNPEGSLWDSPEPARPEGEQGRVDLAKLLWDEPMEPESGATLPPPEVQISDEISGDKGAEELTYRVLRQGIDFLGGLYQLSTGRLPDWEQPALEFDPQAREWIIRIKLPKKGPA